MSYLTPSRRYVENEVLARSPEWLVPLLYETLLSSLRRAAIHIDAGDIERKAAALSHASSIVGELLASLDMEKGGDVASRLASLYSYFALEIMNIGRTLDTAALGRLIQMVQELHGAWVQAAEQVAPRGGKSASIAAA